MPDLLCAVPLTLVVLGAFFYSPPLPEDPAAPAKEPMTFVQRLKSYVGLGGNDGRSTSFTKASLVVGSPNPAAPKATPGENRAVFVAVTSRMIFTPLLFMPVLAVLAKYDLFNAAADPVFIVSPIAPSFSRFLQS